MCSILLPRKLIKKLIGQPFSMLILEKTGLGQPTREQVICLIFFQDRLRNGLIVASSHHQASDYALLQKVVSND